MSRRVIFCHVECVTEEPSQETHLRWRAECVMVRISQILEQMKWSTKQTALAVACRVLKKLRPLSHKTSNGQCKERKTEAPTDLSPLTQKRVWLWPGLQTTFFNTCSGAQSVVAGLRKKDVIAAGS